MRQVPQADDVLRPTKEANIKAASNNGQFCSENDVKKGACRCKEQAMRTHRFRKNKLPATIAIKHQLMKLMFEESVKEARIIARTEEIRLPSEPASSY
jgi:hypothetical protein